MTLVDAGRMHVECLERKIKMDTDTRDVGVPTIRFCVCVCVCVCVALLCYSWYCSLSLIVDVRRVERCIRYPFGLQHYPTFALLLFWYPWKVSGLVCYDYSCRQLSIWFWMESLSFFCIHRPLCWGLRDLIMTGSLSVIILTLPSLCLCSGVFF